MVKRKETINYFVEEAKKSFSFHPFFLEKKVQVAQRKSLRCNHG
jgi:hypothetical protein